MQRVEHDLAAVEDRDRQQIDDAQVDREDGQQQQERRHAGARRVGAYLGDGDGASHVLRRDAQGRHLADHLHRQGRVAPRVAESDAERGEDAVALQPRLQSGGYADVAVFVACVVEPQARRHRHEARAVAAQDRQLQRRFGIRAHDLHELAPLGDGSAVHLGHEVARFDAAFRCRAVRFHAADVGQVQRRDAEGAQRIGVFALRVPAFDGDGVAALLAVAQRVDLDAAALAQPLHQRKVRLAPRGRGPAVHGDDLRAAAHSRVVRGAAVGDRRRGRGDLGAEDGDEPEEHERQHEVRRRASRGDGDSPLRLEAVVGAARSRRVRGRGLRGVRVAPVVKTHVAAERQGGDGELRAVAVAATPQHLAEADAEPHHVDAGPARHEEVPSLVERHQNADGDDEEEHADGRRPGHRKNVVEQSHRFDSTAVPRRKFSGPP